MEITMETKWLNICLHSDVCKNATNKGMGYLECGFGDTRCIHCRRKAWVLGIAKINKREPIVMVVDFAFDDYAKPCEKHPLNCVFLVAKNVGKDNDTALCYECLKEEMGIIEKELSNSCLHLADTDYFISWGNESKNVTK